MNHAVIAKAGQMRALLMVGTGALVFLYSSGFGLVHAKEPGNAPVEKEKVAVAADLSQAFRHVAKVIRPSVVSVNSTRRIQIGQRGRLPEEFRGLFDDETLERFFDFRVPEEGLEQQGLGSGVIVSPDGYILTNNHVVGNADEVNVVLFDKREYSAEIVGTDQSTDLAVLKIEADELIAAELGSSDAIEVGDWVLALGSPFGLAQTVTAGIISAKSRANVGITDYEDFIQTDAAINPGNSGGPLVNLAGKVVGINTAIASRSGGYMGVGFAIPSDMARYVMNSIITEGHVTRGYLGAMIQDLDEDLARSFDYDSTDGVLIGDVVQGGPAGEAGLRPGDIVTKFNGNQVETANELRNAVAATPPETNTTLEISRDGNPQQLQVEIGTLQTDTAKRPRESEGEMAADFGVMLQTLTPEQAEQLGLEQDARGVLVTQVEPGGLGARLGLRPGDVIVSAGGQPIEDTQAFREAMNEQSLQQGIRLQIMRDGVRRFVFIRSNNP